MLASVRAEVLELRRDTAGVLTNLHVLALKQDPEVAKRLASEALTSITAIGDVGSDASSQAQRLRAEVLALRQDVAVVMAKLFLAAGRSKAEVEKIILSALKLRRAEQATDEDPDD